MKIFVENILRSLNAIRKVQDPESTVTSRIIKLSGVRKYNFFYGGGAIKALRKEMKTKMIDSSVSDALGSIPESDEVYPILVSFDKKVPHLDNHIIAEKVYNSISKNINGSRYCIKKHILRPSLVRYTVYDKLRKLTGCTILLANVHGKESDAKKVVKLTMRAVNLSDSGTPVTIPVLIENICDLLTTPFIDLKTNGAQKNVYAIRLTWLLEAAKKFDIPLSPHLLKRAQKSFKSASSN